MQEQLSIFEEWRPVVGYEGVYEVSDRGRVRRIKSGPHTRPGLILKPNINSGGYYRLGLRDNGFYCGVVHRLVAEAFLGPPPTPKHQVNHKDANKLNNHVENLEWVTPLENVRYAHALGIVPNDRGSEHWKSHLTEADVLKIRYGHTGLSNREVGLLYGIGREGARDIRRHKIWKHVQ